MGLDTSHGCWHGAYSAFNHWRDAVAAAAGLALTTADYDALPEGVEYGDWPETPDEPLLVLMAHCDDTGAIHPAQAEALADRLAELMPLIPRVWGRATQRWIDGLRKAAAAGEDVTFG